MLLLKQYVVLDIVWGLKMLSKLRIKFIGISLIIFGVLLAFFFSISYYLAAFQVQKESNEIINGLFANSGKQIIVYNTHSKQITPPNFTVFLNENNKIITNTTISNPSGFIGGNQENLQHLVDLILEREETSGTLKIDGTSGLRYIIGKVKIDELNSIVQITFMSRILESHALEDAKRNSYTLSMYLMVLLLITSFVLSLWTFKPIKKAWDQQHQFLADASHELRTPLTAIKANLDVLLTSPNKTIAEQSKWINYIKDETIRMQSLANDLLFLAKNDMQVNKTNYETFNLSTLALNTILSLEPLAFETQKQLEYKIQENIFISADTNRIKQLLIILLDNAIKYASPNSVIAINITKISRRVQLSIENCFLGEIDVDKIFSRFYRDDNSRNRQTGGSGLGLAIAQSIVKEHDGKINAKSQDRTLTITITLPTIK